PPTPHPSPFIPVPRDLSCYRVHKKMTTPHVETDAHGSAVGEVRPVPFATRPVLQGTFGMVAGGHYLAAAIGLRVLEAGGNAIDAGVATGFALSLLKPQSVGIGGE